MRDVRAARRSILILFVVVLLLPACNRLTGQQSTSTIAIGSKNFTEEFILGEMYADLLEDAGFKVERKLNLGATPVAHEALLKGDIDLYPEYTSTALLTVLKDEPMSDRQAIFEKVKSEYEQRFKLTWLQPAPFNDTQALATTPKIADQFNLRTFSDLSQAAPNLVIGGPPEFFAREDGLPGLQKAYGGFQFKDQRQLDPGLRYQALLNGDIDVVVAFGTDGQLQGYDLVRLEDDKNFYPPYQAAPVVRQDTLSANPGIADALNKVEPLLTNEVMAELNWKVDGPAKMEPAEVARQFLVEKGLIRK
ncbi:MAG: hypothetical protein M5U01_42735 [Ardenticatenaceae bacterium]|nr:hypothetical protein [Ardenticatenaceae bacterium]HBY95582.1 quaternary ammonium transporter [Chloroflexota bacterium]